MVPVQIDESHTIVCVVDKDIDGAAID
jgi:hypothetical protein